MVVGDILVTFETWLVLENFDNIELIRLLWVEMFLKKGARDDWKGRKKGSEATSNWQQIWERACVKMNR